MTERTFQMEPITGFLGTHADGSESVVLHFPGRGWVQVDVVSMVPPHLCSRLSAQADIWATKARKHVLETADQDSVPPWEWRPRAED